LRFISSEYLLSCYNVAIMRILTVLLCTPALFGLVAAQSTKPGSGPCALLTQAEVQAAVGAPVSDGVINKTNQAVCDFKAGATGSTVGIMLTRKSAADSADKTVTALKKSNIKAEAVPGFGEGAYSSSPGYGMQQLGVYKGGSHVIVTVLIIGAPDAKSKTIAQTVMRKALARVP
jgi:hypothetical protein